MSSIKAEQKYEALRMFATGSSLAQVCEATGIADYSARKIKKEAEEYAAMVIPRFKTKVWDIETTDFKADIGTLGVSSFLDLDAGVPNTRHLHDFEGTLLDRERQLAEWTQAQIAESDVIIGHNVKAFDRNFLNGVSARHGLSLVPKRIYLDTMLTHRYGVKGKIGSSMANIADVYGLPVPKDAPSKNDWRLYIGGDPDAVDRITRRCELDVVATAFMWQHFREYFFEWKGER